MILKFICFKRNENDARGINVNKIDNINSEVVKNFTSFIFSIMKLLA